MKQVEAAIIGTGWSGGIRARTRAQAARVAKLHPCEIREARRAEAAQPTGAASATTDYHDITRNPAIEVVYISTTPEGPHYPIARDCLKAGKHVLLEKPIGLDLSEA